MLSIRSQPGRQRHRRISRCRKLCNRRALPLDSQAHAFAGCLVRPRRWRAQYMRRAPRRVVVCRTRRPTRHGHRPNRHCEWSVNDCGLSVQAACTCARSRPTHADACGTASVGAGTLHPPHLPRRAHAHAHAHAHLPPYAQHPDARHAHSHARAQRSAPLRRPAAHQRNAQRCLLWPPC
jgi:hypothetical protein